MRKLNIRFAVAVITFTIGMMIPPLSRSPAVPNSNPVDKEIDEIVAAPQAKALPSSPPERKATGRSDLSIAIQVSGVHPDPPSFELRYIKLSKRGPTIIDLNLAEYVDRSEVELNFRDSSVSYRMFQRYRTSMSISAEGPHLDLVDWRHFDSPWIPLDSLGDKRFRTLPADQMQDSRFPSTTKSDIIKEVRKRVGKDWPDLLELVKDCRGPNDGACRVGISSIYLRIQKKIRDGWIDVGLVEFRIPMGC